MKYKELKDRFFGLGLILCIILFTFSILRISQKKNSIEVKKLERIIELQTDRKKSADFNDKEITNKISTIIDQTEKQKNSFDSFQKTYKYNIIESKKIKYEKNFIPVNTDNDDKFIFITGYKYEKY